MKLSRVSLGLMGMGAGDTDEQVKTIRAAYERGINVVNTGDFYGVGASKTVLGRALKEIGRENIFISVKFGVTFSPLGGGTQRDCRPQSVANFLTYSMKRLGTDYVDLYEPARLDPNVPIEDTVGMISRLIEAGFVRHLGMSEVEMDTIRRAHAVHPVHSLEIEYSLLRRARVDEMLPELRDMGISIAGYGILFHGLLSETPPAYALEGEQGARDAAAVERLRAYAAGQGISAAQLAIAWALAQGHDILPIVGASRRARLDDITGALTLELTQAQCREIESLTEGK